MSGSVGKPGHAAAQVSVDPDLYEKNEFGGIRVTRADVEEAFRFLDAESKGHISLEDLRGRLSAFYGDLPIREYQFLLGDRKELRLRDLHAMLRDNEITGFDPVAEAFKVYDPEGKGFVDPSLLRSVFERLGFGKVGDEDLQILLESADADGDGKISLEDFRALVDFGGSFSRDRKGAAKKG